MYYTGWMKRIADKFRFFITQYNSYEPDKDGFNWKKYIEEMMSEV